jgi:acyl dehydratase
MVVDAGLAGRTFAPTPPYTVSREKILEFSSGAVPLADGHVAPLTFPILVAFQAMTQFLAEPGIGLELHHVVHGSQRIEQIRPIGSGDHLTATLTIDSVRSAAGADIISTSTKVSTVEGEHVSTAQATLVHRSEAP